MKDWKLYVERDIQLFNYEKTSQSEQGSSVQAGPGALDQEGSFLEGEGRIRDRG